MRRPGFLLLLLPLLFACGPSPESKSHEPAPGSGPTALSVSELLGGTDAGSDNRGFARATTPIDFEFPRDHGGHESFRTEWWYVTGNLQTSPVPAATAQRFGFQLTFFRQALKAPTAAEPTPSEPPSSWRTDHVWMAHFAMSRVGASNSRNASGEFRFAERFARGGPLDLAGVRTDPSFRVHLGSWELRSAQTGDFLPLHVKADDPAQGIALDLTLSPGEGAKPLVLQGERGLSRKSSAPGNASHYYSFTRLPATGTVRFSSEGELSVSGLAWIDREWSTSALGEGVVGWDWFALQLDDGWDVMLYRLRRADGTADPFSAGSLVSPDGAIRTLALDDIQLEPVETFTTTDRAATYPTRWRLRIPSANLELDVRSRLNNQELRAAVRYWEGAVDITGAHDGRAIAGSGFSELTGYAAGF